MRRRKRKNTACCAPIKVSENSNIKINMYAFIQAPPHTIIAYVVNVRIRVYSSAKHTLPQTVKPTTKKDFNVKQQPCGDRKTRRYLRISIASSESRMVVRIKRTTIRRKKSHMVKNIAQYWGVFKSSVWPHCLDG